MWLGALIHKRLQKKKKANSKRINRSNALKEGKKVGQWNGREDHENSVSENSQRHVSASAQDVWQPAFHILHCCRNPASQRVAWLINDTHCSPFQWGTTMGEFGLGAQELENLSRQKRAAG